MEEGFVPAPSRRFEGVGFSEIVRVRNRVLALAAAGEKLWRFEGGEPYLPTPERIKNAMRRALERNDTRYAPSSGIPPLRRAIVEKVRSRNGIPADEEAALVVAGGMHGLFAAFSALLDPGDEVLLLSPYWTPIVDVVAFHGARPVLVPASSVESEGVAAAFERAASPRTKAVYWNSPANPTGAVYGRRAVEELARFVQRRGLALVSDEAYEDLIYEGEAGASPASLPGMWDRTITVFTLSKTYAMTGWRLGYLVAPPRWRSALETVVLYSVNGVSTPGQWAAVEALSMPDESFEEARAGYRRRRDRLVEGLRESGFELETPRAALYAFPRLPGHMGKDSRAAARTLLEEARIATVPGVVFGPEGEGHLRFSFSVSEETIAGGMEALKAFAAASAR